MKNIPLEIPASRGGPDAIFQLHTATPCAFLAINEYQEVSAHLELPDCLAICSQNFFKNVKSQNFGGKIA